MTERVIGIDFGTSTSVIRVQRYENGTALDPIPKAVTFNNGSPMVPTLIQKPEGGQGTYYGYDAEVQRRRAKTYRNFKLALESGDAAEREEARALTAEYFRYLGEIYRHQSEGGFLGESGDRVTTLVSYPVKWSEETRAFMLKAARDAGFPAVEGLDEAQAAIRAVTAQYADILSEKGYFRKNVPCTILLIDMGAGTTDLVLCRHTPGDEPKTEILCTWPQHGEALFGGSTIDELLYRYITDSFPDMQAVSRLPLSKFKAWKESVVSPALLRGESADYLEALKPIEDALDIDLHFDPIDRAKFESIASGYLPQLPKLINDALSAARLMGAAVDIVLLTGGHSQWYFVREMLCGALNTFGAVELPKIAAEPERIISVTRPQETVALGLVWRPEAKMVEKSKAEPKKEQEPAPKKPSVPKEEPTPEEEFELGSAGDGYVITKYIGSRSRVIIPETIRGRKVVAIGMNAFVRLKGSGFLAKFENDELRYVEVPESVRTIEDRAFTACIHLSRVKLPGKLERIGGYAFENCGELTYLSFGDQKAEPGIARFPESVKKIGSSAFCRNGIKAIFREVSVSKRTNCAGLFGPSYVFGANCAIFRY